METHIPKFGEINGANFFDPFKSHLHLILRGPEVVTIKTQPVVILKLGLAVPEENFFEENVIANIAGLLGIDPSTIRITKIVREGTTGRKKRSSGIVTNVEFEIVA